MHAGARHSPQHSAAEAAVRRVTEAELTWTLTLGVTAHSDTAREVTVDAATAEGRLVVDETVNSMMDTKSKPVIGRMGKKITLGGRGS